jgi:peptidoglycan/LPS O-acetylase OafA/YrhL
VRRAPAVVLAIVCTVLPIAVQCAADRHAGWLMVDFRAYYCASLTQRVNANPYFTAPLHRCENGTPAPYYRAPARVTVPAPYPPYALAMLAPLTLLPFGLAAVLWWFCLAGAIILAAYAVTRTTAQPALTGWAVVGLSLGLTCFSAGNAMPLAVAAVALAAFYAQRGKLTAAALAATAGMIEPQVALPAVVGLFVGFRSIRITLSSALLVLAAISIASGGFAHNLAYFTTVLPAHALSEVSRDNQYSLSTVIAALGVPDRPAVLAGSVSYLAMLGLGVAVGLALARRYREPAFIPLVPCAFALLGGSFAHTEAIAAAVPAALLLYVRAREHRGLLFGSLVLLAVPWMYASSVALFLAPFYPVAYLTYVLWRRDRAIAAAAGLAAGAAILGLFALAGSSSHVVAGLAPHPPIDPRLAEASWRDFVLGNSTNRLSMWLLRLPTWAGLIGFVIAAIANSRISAAAAAFLSKPFRGPRLAGIDFRHNAIGFLRFLFAAAVIWSHAYGLGGFGYDPIGVFSNHAFSGGLLAVGGFFVLSGFLITRSYESTPSLGRFVWHRFLRIFPGYWVCLAIVAFGFASLAFAHEHGMAFPLFSSGDSGSSYVFGNAALFIRQEGIAGLLAGLPFPFVFDGSLWTLQYEFLCYLLIGALGISGVFRRAPAAVAIISLWLFFIYAGLLREYATHGMPIALNLLSLFVYFGFGASAYLFRERIPMRSWIAAAAAAGLIFGLVLQPAALLVAPSMSYLTLYAAMNLPVRSFDRRIDLSYGLYIYAFPVAQLLSLYRVNQLGFLPYLAAGSSIAVALAAASWFGVERPCLSLKSVVLKTGAGISATHQRRAPESR